MVFKKRNSTKKNPQRGRVCGQREFSIIYIYKVRLRYINNVVHFTNILVHTTQTTLVTFL